MKNHQKWNPVKKQFKTTKHHQPWIKTHQRPKKLETIQNRPKNSSQTCKIKILKHSKKHPKFPYFQSHFSCETKWCPTNPGGRLVAVLQTVSEALTQCGATLQREADVFFPNSLGGLHFVIVRYFVILYIVNVTVIVNCCLLWVEILFFCYC